MRASSTGSPGRTLRADGPSTAAVEFPAGELASTGLPGTGNG